MLSLLLALAIKKVEYDALDLENYMPNSLTNKEKRARSSSPSVSNLMIVLTSRNVGLMLAKGKIKPCMKVAQNPRKSNIKVMLIRMPCQNCMIRL